MELAVKSTYSEQPNGHMECAPFARLQRLGNIVEAVVVFAYTGSIEISMDNAVRLFLLASNLGSRTITSWCAEFLRPRFVA
ncbi:unnamed protein product [Mesocestoides corti]|uniref:BTB domain-containing protein n=1 Tax=Mesocestoides corti TaxID=53468 RepID=A0A0R3UC53_MESCO|nr:unnamed protein product [Mesocestoides corti]